MPSARLYEVAVVCTEPSIKVVPAGRCSSTIKKSRSHSGVVSGMVRQAVMATRALASQRDLAGQVFKVGCVDRHAETHRQYLAIELGCRREIDAAIDRRDTVCRCPGRA